MANSSTMDSHLNLGFFPNNINFCTILYLNPRPNVKLATKQLCITIGDHVVSKTGDAHDLLCNYGRDSGRKSEPNRCCKSSLPIWKMNLRCSSSALVLVARVVICSTKLDRWQTLKISIMLFCRKCGRTFNNSVAPVQQRSTKQLSKTRTKSSS